MLRPHLEDLIQKYKNGEDKIRLDQRDYYGMPYYEEYAKIDNHPNFASPFVHKRITQIGGILFFEAYVLLKKRYDNATLGWRSDMPIGIYEFSKELKGKGNGFYANVEGEKIVEAEWD